MGILERLIESSLRRRGLVIVGVLFLAALGVWSALNIPIDAFPDVTNIQVEVLSTAPGMSPPEVERFVTYPIEVAMRGLPRLSLVRSISKSGLSVVTVIFEDGVDIYFARQQVLERLIEAREQVPENVQISMGPVSTAMGEIYPVYAGKLRPRSGRELDDFLTRAADRPGLDAWRRCSRASRASMRSIPSAAYIKQYHVNVDPEKLLAYDLTLAEVGDSLRTQQPQCGRQHPRSAAKGSTSSAASACCRRSRISAPWS